MKNTRLLLQIPAVLATLLAIAGPAAAVEPAKPAAKPAMTFSFGGTTYVHRGSKGSQHEFTPEEDSDLSKWNNKVILTLHEDATTPEKAAQVANTVLKGYQLTGKILKTSSRPATADRPAEHLIVAASGGSLNYLEVTFVRVMLVDGVTEAVAFLHRAYGYPASPAMAKWLEAEAPGAENALMLWADVPKPVDLRKLPVAMK